MEYYSKRQTGTRYEDVAVSFLIKKGHTILKRNYRNPYGEIDIISRIDDTIVFTECKYRQNNRYGDPLEAVNYIKQRRISKGALYFCSRFLKGREAACRFDVVAVYGNGTIRHIENAFDFRG